MTTTPTVWLDSFQVNTSATGFQGMQDIVGLSNGNFLVVFADDSGAVGTGNGRDIIGVIYDAEGSIVTTAFQVNTFGNADTEETPAIAATNDGGFVMVYEDRDTTAPTQQILIQRYKRLGHVDRHGLCPDGADNGLRLGSQDCGKSNPTTRCLSRTSGRTETMIRSAASGWIRT